MYRGAAAPLHPRCSLGTGSASEPERLPRRRMARGATCIRYHRSRHMTFATTRTQPDVRVLDEAELDVVSGGFFDIGRIIGSIIKAPLPPVIDVVVPSF